MSTRLASFVQVMVAIISQRLDLRVTRTLNATRNTCTFTEMSTGSILKYPPQLASLQSIRIMYLSQSWLQPHLEIVRINGSINFTGTDDRRFLVMSSWMHYWFHCRVTILWLFEMVPLNLILGIVRKTLASQVFLRLKLYTKINPQKTHFER